LATRTSAAFESNLFPPTLEHVTIQNEEEILLKAWSILSGSSAAPDSSELVWANGIIAKSHDQLEKIFDDDGESRVKVEEENFEEKRLPRVFEHYRPKVTDLTLGKPVTVSQSDFSKRFKECCHGLLEGLDWKNLMVAGGSILSCLLPDQEHEYSHADVDFFVLTRDVKEADRITHHIFNVISGNASRLLEERYRKVDCIRTERTVTIRTAWKMFQVVTTLYDSPLEVLIGFDVDCGSVGTLDGETAVLTKRAKMALSKRYNLWMLDTRPSLAVERRYQSRLLKYGKKGFAVLIPNVDWSKIESLDRKRVEQVTGVAKLALYDRFLTTSQSNPDRKNYKESHLFVSGIDECIHGGHSWCKNCHKMLPHDEADPSARLSFATPIHWEHHNVVYQDIEGGVIVRDISSHYTPQIDFHRLAYAEGDGNTALSAVQHDPTESKRKENPTADALDDIYISAADSKPSPPPIHLSSTLSTQAGIVFPNCYCGTLCSLKAVKKNGPNHHRRFFCCPNSMLPTSCKFFQWEDQELNFDQAKAQRWRETVDMEEMTEAVQSLQLDTSKQLLVLASCFKSGRITSECRSSLKDTILQHAQENTSPLDPLFSAFSQHMDLDLLAKQLTDHFKAASGTRV
jgi:hypothetical protein